ncbi:MAG: hypothetical protein ACRC7N_13515 [Clostridium sp.]
MKNGCREYFIVMVDYDTFKLKIADVDRPNDMSDDEIISKYMVDNYYGHSYQVIDKDNSGFETIEI